MVQPSQREIRGERTLIFENNQEHQKYCLFFCTNPKELPNCQSLYTGTQMLELLFAIHLEPFKLPSMHTPTRNHQHCHSRNYNQSILDCYCLSSNEIIFNFNLGLFLILDNNEMSKFYYFFLNI